MEGQETPRTRARPVLTTSSPRDTNEPAVALGGAQPAQRGPDGAGSRGDIDMRIARDGTWFYHGSPIGRKPLVKLFAGVLRRDDDGSFWLVTPVERCAVTVEDAPFVAVDVTRSGSGEDQALTFRTNLDELVAADADHTIRIAHDAAGGHLAPYILVRDRLEALIARPVYYELVDLGVAAHPGSAVVGVWSHGTFFELGRLDEEAAGA